MQGLLVSNFRTKTNCGWLSDRIVLPFYLPERQVSMCVKFLSKVFSLSDQSITQVWDPRFVSGSRRGLSTFTRVTHRRHLPETTSLPRGQDNFYFGKKYFPHPFLIRFCYWYYKYVSVNNFYRQKFYYYIKKIPLAGRVCFHPAQLWLSHLCYLPDVTIAGTGYWDNSGLKIL